MSKNTKAMIDSYLRNLLGQIVSAVSIVMAAKGLASPTEFGSGEWLLVANTLWGSAVPTLIRYANKKDPAFGRVADVVAADVTKKLDTAAKKAPAKKAAAKKVSK
jgi:hypothetical protein